MPDKPKEISAEEMRELLTDAVNSFQLTEGKMETLRQGAALQPGGRIRLDGIFPRRRVNKDAVPIRFPSIKFQMPGNFITGNFISSVGAVESTDDDMERVPKDNGIRDYEQEDRNLSALDSAFTPAVSGTPEKPQIARGLIVKINPDCLAFMRTLKTISLDLTKPAAAQPTQPMFVSGTVFYLDPKSPLKLAEGTPVTVKTCVPPDRMGETIIFDEVHISALADANGNLSVTATDPRDPAAIDGTPEFTARVYRALHYKPS